MTHIEALRWATQNQELGHDALIEGVEGRGLDDLERQKYFAYIWILMNPSVKANCA